MLLILGGAIMKLLIYSDLHLEFGTDFKPPADSDADVMILAGDITIFTKNKLNKLSKFLEGWTKPVLYIAGNHEYYTRKCMKRVRGSFKKWATIKHPNLIFLEDEEITIDGVHFFGGTMWTDFNKGNPLAMEVAAQCMNDYNLIYLGEESIHPDDTVKFHNIYVEKLKAWFAKDLLGRRIVISHHAPCVNPNGFYKGSNLQDAYNSLDMIPIVEEYKPTLWIYGHTHEPDDQMIFDTRIISNPRGYPYRSGSHECKEFKDDGIGIIV